jgi:steroid delta-isomerase-like uncharacterized protein
MGTTEQQTTLDPAFAVDFARRFDEAWASKDPERVASLCTEDVVWADPALRAPLRGRAGVREFITASFRMAPDFTVETFDGPFLSPPGARILMPYRMSGTMTGPWPFLDLAPTGRRFSIEGIDSWRIRDGLMERYDTYWDTTEMSRQLGVLPAQGSPADRAMSRLQHVQARFQRRSTR